VCPARSELCEVDWDCWRAVYESAVAGMASSCGLQQQRPHQELPHLLAASPWPSHSAGLKPGFLLAPPQARLFMCYVATHPEKLDEQRAEQWRKVTRLTPQQFAAVSNLEYLGVPVFKRASSGSGLFFNRKRKRNIRRVRSRHCGRLCAVGNQPACWDAHVLELFSIATRDVRALLSCLDMCTRCHVSGVVTFDRMCTSSQADSVGVSS